MCSPSVLSLPTLNGRSGSTPRANARSFRHLTAHLFWLYLCAMLPRTLRNTCEFLAPSSSTSVLVIPVSGS
eukprot:267799-Pyramimonas_sp.AAC.1